MRGDTFHVYNPPWVLFPLIPFEIVPYGRALMLVAAISISGFTAARLGASPLAVALFIFSPLVFDALAWGNVEWLAILGFVVTPGFGLLLLVLKPQVTIAAIVFLIVESWRTRGWHGTVRLVAPLAVVTLLSFVAFGLWPLETASYMDNRNSPMNISLFPWSVPFGIILFVQSLRTHNIRYAIAASPMLSPIVTPPNWIGVFLALTPSLPKISTASIGLWSFLFVRAIWFWT